MEETPDEKPPLFTSWSTWYLVVTGFLVLLICSFFWFTKHYS